jgi:hypothetical protein
MMQSAREAAKLVGSVERRSNEGEFCESAATLANSFSFSEDVFNGVEPMIIGRCRMQGLPFTDLALTLLY